MAGTFDTLQSLTTDIAELFGTWRERLREKVEMTSPDGNTFSPLWAGSPRSYSKKLGRFNFPKVRGTYIQDLDVNGDAYPMTLFFDGDDNDKDAKRFFDAGKENGRWQVTHPVHGDLELQLSSMSELNDPTNSGNVTAVEVEFLESIDLPPAKAATSAAIKNAGFLANAAAALQFADNAVKDAFAAAQTVRDFAASGQVIIRAATEPLFTASAEINNLFNGINNSITDTLDAAILDPLKLAGQFQQLIQVPALATTNIQSRLDAYQNILDSIFEVPIVDPTPEGKNAIATIELIASAALVGSAQSAGDAELNSRAEAVESNEILINQFSTTTDALDDSQSAFDNVPIDQQYFSQSSTFPELAKLIGLGIQHLNALIFTLSTERRFILKTFRTPWEIAVSEYGSTGELDANIDLFILSNNLHGNDILVLPPGREVVVYG